MALVNVVWYYYHFGEDGSKIPYQVLSLSKLAQLWIEFGQFKHNDFEPFFEAWERFKDLLRRCHQYGYQNWMQVEIFYNGLNGQTRTTVDAAARGTLMSKTTENTYSLLDGMANGQMSIQV